MNTTEVTTPLSETERAALSDAETIIAAGMQTFMEVGRALRVISEERLYREQYTRFEDYCVERWGMSHAHGYRMIAAYNVSEAVAPIAVLTAESQARPLLELDTPLEQQVAVALAYRAAQVETEGRLTAALIKDSVATVQEMRTTAGHVDLGNGTMNAGVASVIVKHHDRVQERIDAAQRKRTAKAGQLVVLIKNAVVRVVSSTNSHRVTLEFESEVEAGKLRELLNGNEDAKIEISAVRIYPPEGENNNGATTISGDSGSKSAKGGD